ncbi:MAG: acyltransferase [Collinsella sp.]|nr:acyltransferase [Collinsella sp.]
MTALSTPQLEQAGARPTRVRDIRYDVVRVVAMAFVVAVHALMIVDADTPAGNVVTVLGQTVFFTCNALFFILSGKFNLTKRNAEDPGRYYLRKVRGIIVPVLILFFLRTVYNLWPALPGPRALAVTYVKNVLGDLSGSEYWFVYILVSFLAVVPFLAPAFTAMGRARQRLFLGMGLAWFCLLFFMRSRGITFSWSYLFTGFAFPFFIGPFVEDYMAEGHAARAIFAAMPICALATVALVLAGMTSQAQGAFDNSPFYMVLSIGMYLALLRLGGLVRGERARAVIAFAARHSFTVYLVHMPVMHLLRGLMPAAPGALGFVLHPVLTAATILVSLAVALAIDTALVRPAQRLFDLAAARIGTRAAR